MREDYIFPETSKNPCLKLISLIINLCLITVLWYMWNTESRENEVSTLLSLGT